MKLRWVLSAPAVFLVTALGLAACTATLPSSAAPPEAVENVTVPVVADNTTAAPASSASIETAPEQEKAQALAVTGVQYVVSSSSASISWETNEYVTCLMKYGTDPSLSFETSPDQSGTSHNVLLNGLAPATRYHYKIFSTDAAGHTTVGEEMTFSTAQSNCSPYLGGVAPDFALINLDGSKAVLSQYRGKKVILNFWEIWCGACQAELPTIQAVWRKYSGDSHVALVTVAGGSDMDGLRSFMAQNKVDFPACLDQAGRVFSIYGITSTPRTFFLDKSGVIHKIEQGWFTSTGQVDTMLDSY